MNLKDINNALIICPNDYKENLLESFNNEKAIYNVKFMTLDEYKRNYYFDYDAKAIKELVDNGLSPENAKEIIDNLVYIDKRDYNNDKLDKLVEYKKNLINKGLLIENKLFKSYISNKNIYVLGYGKLNSFYQSMLKGKTVNILDFDEKNKKYTINTFQDIEEEVEFVYNSIYDLFEKGVDINNIYVMNANKDYNAYFKRFNKYYGFNIQANTTSKLIGTKLAEEFIEMLNTETKEDIYEYINNNNTIVSKKLINILNKYAEFEIEDVKDLIINDIKNTNYSVKVKNIVRNIDILSCVNENDYIFFVGFNDSTPNMEKDVDYITDNIKHLVNLPTTEENNKLKRDNLKCYLSNINNLVLSYCKNSPFNTYNKQIIFNDDACEYKEIINKTYLKDLNKVKFTDELDKLRKFNYIHEDIDKYFNSYGKNDYLTYNNKFKGLSDKQIESIPNQIKRNNNNEITLSYSSMNNFNECNFKYYLDNVLKVKDPFGNYYTKLGTVCHGALEDLYNIKDFDFETSWKNQIKKEEEKENICIFNDECEKYFVGRIKEELRNDIDVVKKQKANSEFNKEKCENNFTFKVEDRINFTGFIDKIMYKETDDEIIASVVDYKTSKSIEIDKDIMKYGLSLQLPSYLYLMKHSKEFDKTLIFVGLYIQHIINFDNKYKDENTSLDDKKAESLKLDGISSIDPGRVMVGDITLEPCKGSENIKGLSMNKDGSLKKSSKTYTDEQFDELSEIVENSIKRAGNAILKGDFTINPKEIDGENKSCRYCKYAPICYKKASDLIYIDTKKEEQ